MGLIDQEASDAALEFQVFLGTSTYASGHPLLESDRLSGKDGVHRRSVKRTRASYVSGARSKHVGWSLTEIQAMAIDRVRRTKE